MTDVFQAKSKQDKEFKIRLEEEIFNKQLLGSVVKETKIMNLRF